MALQKEAVWQGIVIPEAYYRAHTWRTSIIPLGDRVVAEGVVHVDGFVSQEVSGDQANRFIALDFPMTPSEVYGLTGKRPPQEFSEDIPEFEGVLDAEKIYNWLTKKPEFEGARKA